MDKVEVVNGEKEKKYILNGELVLDEEELWTYIVSKARKYDDNNDDDDDE